MTWNSHVPIKPRVKIFHGGLWHTYSEGCIRVHKITKNLTPGISTCEFEVDLGYLLDSGEFKKTNLTEEDLKNAWIQILTPSTLTYTGIGTLEGESSGDENPDENPEEEEDGNIANLATDTFGYKHREYIPIDKQRSEDSTSWDEDKIIFFGNIFAITHVYGGTNQQLMCKCYDMGGWLNTQKLEYVIQRGFDDEYYASNNIKTFNILTDAAIQGNKDTYGNVTVPHPFVNRENEDGEEIPEDELPYIKGSAFRDWDTEGATVASGESPLWTGYDIISFVFNYINSFYYQFEENYNLIFHWEDKAGLENLNDIVVDIRGKSIWQVVSQVIDRKKGLAGYWTFPSDLDSNGNQEIILEIVTGNKISTTQFIPNAKQIDYTQKNGYPSRMVSGQIHKTQNLSKTAQKIVVRTNPISIIGTFRAEEKTDDDTYSHTLKSEWNEDDLPAEFDFTFNDYDGIYDHVGTRFSFNPLAEIYFQTLEGDSPTNTLCLEHSKESKLSFSEYKRFTFSDSLKMSKNVPVKIPKHTDINWDEHVPNEGINSLRYNEKESFQPSVFSYENNTYVGEPQARLLADDRNSIKIQPDDDDYGQNYLRDEERKNKLRLTCMIEGCQPLEYIFDADDYDATQPVTTLEINLDYTPVVLLPDTILITRDESEEDEYYIKWFRPNGDYESSESENVPRIINNLPQNPTANDFIEKKLWQYVHALVEYIKREQQLVTWSLPFIDFNNDEILGSFLNTIEAQDLIDVSGQEIQDNDKWITINSETIITKIDYNFLTQQTSYSTDWFDLNI